ncbi:hypothetical protein TWF679_004504 [Orbilia oligospora]|uniref:VPS9 domain-containing protein n=1 Tax=Orbilia oligospora TaxID=2813651 RepID=A0A8H8UQ89_ORBOL|nr:hypothetical protein TWF679_004504 [Orbilia oligospora]
MHPESSLPRSTKTLGSVRSFTRLESQSPPTRSRSATLNSTIGPGVPSSFGAFSESNFTYDSVDYVEGSHLTGLGDPDDQSLSAKIHPAPVSIDLLSTMFQDFYETTTTPISVHVSKLFSSHDPQASDQPLVSMNEIVQRKKDRKRRDTLQVALQEMVEKRVTEAVFDRIWRHYGAEDEARDEALRSKTMALAVVGIGLKELGLEDNINLMDLRPVCEGENCSLCYKMFYFPFHITNQDFIALRDLNTTKCPRDKLRLLKRAHKAIVDTLTSVVPSTSSSADHILPILIYSLIISPPSVHIVSNLLYIQRFRYHRSIDGEAAYCLTNLEAAISFLETVDMGTLAADESRVTAPVELEPDRISSTSLLPYAEHTGNRPLAVITPAIADTSPANAPPRSETRAQKEAPVVPSMTGATRRMTYLTPVEFATSAATSAVNTADQSLKTIGNSLENSYRFLFGKLSDKRTDLPKTLEDVRKLVGTPVQDLEPPRGTDIYRHPYSEGLKTMGSHIGDGLVTSMRRAETSDTSNNTREETVKVPQDHEIITDMPLSTIEPSASQGAAYTPVAESVRNLGSHLGRFAGNINVIRSFSRGQMPKTPPPGSSGTTNFDSINSSSGAPQDKTVTKIDPPIARFLDTEVADLRIGDIDLLLQDYRRLAAALKSAGAF